MAKLTEFQRKMGLTLGAYVSADDVSIADRIEWLRIVASRILDDIETVRKAR